MSHQTVDTFDSARWRSLSSADTLRLLADYAKQDRSFIPRTSHQSTRWHARGNDAESGFLRTGQKILPARDCKGGGGAVDMAMHLLRLDFKAAASLWRSKGM